jgi:chromate transporter
VHKEAQVTNMPHGAFARHWQEIAVCFLKLGATAYGGPAIMGLIQTELQEKRQWVSKARFLEGVAFIQLLPGPGLVQLSTFLGYVRGGWWGALLAGLCFTLPGIGIMLALTLTYAYLGATPTMRAGLSGLGPVVLGIFMVALYRLGRAAATTIPQLLIAIMAAAALAFTPLGIVAILALAAAVGIWHFHSPRVGAVLFLGLTALLALMYLGMWFPSFTLAPGAHATASASPTSLMELGLFFFKVGALTFGGGSMMIAFIQGQMVHQWHWLTPQEFLDGLALGQLTPGPVLVVTAYVGYKVAGMVGAGIAATASYAPSFILMLTMLPMFERVRTLGWITAAMQGVGPAVSGMFAVTLVRMAPHALPDLFAITILIGTLVALLTLHIGGITLILGGAGLGILRSRLCALPGVRPTLRHICSNVGA